MDYYPWLQYGHILALVYWLGGDLGTYFASGYVLRRDLSVETRQVALKIMTACDQGPMLAMPASFVLGFQMALSLGWLTAPGWLAALVWTLCLAWFANVLILHRCQGKPFRVKLAQLDFGFRLSVIAAIAAAALIGLAGADYLKAERIAWKMLAFDLMVICGVLIRQRLRPFAPAFAKLVAEGPSDAVNDALESSLTRCKPYVWVIWGGLFLNAAIGVRLL